MEDVKSLNQAGMKAVTGARRWGQKMQGEQSGWAGVHPNGPDPRRHRWQGPGLLRLGHRWDSGAHGEREYVLAESPVEGTFETFQAQVARCLSVRNPVSHCLGK